MIVNNNYEEIYEFINSNDNIVEGFRPEVLDENGVEPIIKSYRRGEEKTEFLDLLTIEAAPEQHLDVLAENFTLTFDLGETPEAVDCFVLLGYYNPEFPKDMALRHFEIYFADDKATLYDGENLVYAYHNDKETEGKGMFRTGKWADVMITFDKPIKHRYFGFKNLGPNRFDDVARIGHIGLYSKNYTDCHSFIHNLYGENALRPENIKVKGRYVGFKPSLCDNKAFSDERISVEKGAEIIIRERSAFDCTDVYVAANEADALLINGEKTEVISAPRGEYIYTAKNDNSEKIVITILKDVFISEIGLSSGVRRFEVTDKVVTEDFRGFGTNALPMAFMKASIEAGYNEALWAEECRRVMLSPPRVIRMWFQPDWFIIDEESYYNHVYDFETPDMKSVYRHLDLYKAAGCEIQFNFGWKVGDKVWDWYVLDGIEGNARRNSAPKDLDEFAYSCAATLQELIVNRGYTNIKYLTFYNEPNWNFFDEGDFQISLDIDKATLDTDYKRQKPKMDYWMDMLRKTHTELKAFGLADRVEMWGPETSCADTTKIIWAEEFEKVNDIIDVHTSHRYNLSYDEVDMYCGFMSEATSKPLAITEFNVFPEWRNWRRNNVEMMIEYARHGVVSALQWVQAGVFITGTISFPLTGPGCGWNVMTATPDKVNQPFYDMCLFMRYVPQHSKVLYSTSYSLDERITAFLTPAGDTVIAVESKDYGSERTLKISLPTTTEKKFHKFSVNWDMDLEERPHIPYCEKEIIADGELCDTIRGGYSLTLYTTEKPYEQIICDKGYVELEKGESFEITYNFHDTVGGEVEYSIVAGDEFISLDGNKITAVSDGMAAVKAECKTVGNPCYDIVLVKIGKKTDE